MTVRRNHRLHPSRISTHVCEFEKTMLAMSSTRGTTGRTGCRWCSMPASGPLVLEGATLPHELRELPKPPVRVFTLGEVPRGPRVGVVGTRSPTPEAEEYARQLAFDLARAGVAVVSGGALGIDAAAHRGALDAGGVTLLVAPSSLERPFPAEHAELFDQIVAGGGAQLSPFATGVVPRRSQFFLRNACLVALSHALVVVEAPLRSGARNAAHWARELGRPYFVVTSPPWNARGLGCIAELELGARPLASVATLLRCLREQELHPLPRAEVVPRAEVSAVSPSADPVIPPPPTPNDGKKRRKSRQRASSADGLGDAIFELLHAGALHPDEIAVSLSVSAAEVSHAVLLLLLQGRVQETRAGSLTRVH
jgi:DNA processing protein